MLISKPLRHLIGNFSGACGIAPLLFSVSLSPSGYEILPWRFSIGAFAITARDQRASAIPLPRFDDLDQRGGAECARCD
jgi:hypothetical protein